MESTDLEKLKAEIAAEEAEIKKAEDAGESGNDEPKNVGDEPDKKESGISEGAADKDEATSDDDGWLKEEGSDEDNSEDSRSFSDGDMAAVRRKYKAKSEDQKTEIEALREELREAKGAKAENSSALKRPEIKDFDMSDDPDEAYAQALSDYRLKVSESKIRAKRIESDQRESNERYLSEVKASVNDHYERAEKLAKNSGISVDTYMAADAKFRSEMNALGGKEDATADAIIALLGDGSERVTYNLSVNPRRMEVLKNHLREDVSGNRATAFLTELKLTLKAPQRKQTRVRPPAANISGDGIAGSSGVSAAYKAAEASGDIQKMLDARSAARKAGIDITNW